MPGKHINSPEILASPRPFDVEPPLEPAIDTTDYSGVFNAWATGELTDASNRQEAVVILTRPDGYELPYEFPPESQKHLLTVPAEITGDTNTTLRSFLRDKPDLALELATGIHGWYVHCGQDDQSPDCIARLQTEYQDLILEILPAAPPETDVTLIKLYPGIRSKAVQQGLADYLPTARLLNDPDIPLFIKNEAVHKWIDLAKEEASSKNPDEYNPPYQSWLSEFFGPWAAGPNAEPDAVEDIINYFEKHAGLPSDGIYTEPRLAGKISRHLTIPELFYGFSMRHVLYEKTRESDPEAFELLTDYDDELLKKLDKEHRTRNFMSNILGPLLGSRRSGPSPYEIRSEQLWQNRKPRPKTYTT